MSNAYFRAPWRPRAWHGVLVMLIATAAGAAALFMRAEIVPPGCVNRLTYWTRPGSARPGTSAALTPTTSASQT